MFRVLIYMECDKAKVLMLGLRSVSCHGYHVNAHESDTTTNIQFASTSNSGTQIVY